MVVEVMVAFASLRPNDPRMFIDVRRDHRLGFHDKRLMRLYD